MIKVRIGDLTATYNPRTNRWVSSDKALQRALNNTLEPSSPDYPSEDTLDQVITWAEAFFDDLEVLERPEPVSDAGTSPMRVY